jgi:hypothetical protein
MGRAGNGTPAAQGAVTVRDRVVMDRNPYALRDSFQILDEDSSAEHALTSGLACERDASRLGCRGYHAVLDGVELQVLRRL